MEKRIANSSFFVELLLRQRDFGHTYTQKHVKTYLKFSSPKLLKPRKEGFCKVEREIKNEFSCLNRLKISPFLVELLFREHIFSHTHTQKHPSTYPKF